MKLLVALRRLSRRPLLVAVAVLAAVLVGLGVTHQIPSLKDRQRQVGIASASALIDSSRSQLAALGVYSESDVTTLAGRASLLASLMATPDLKDRIARLAGVAPNDLIAHAPANVGAPKSPAPATQTRISSSNPRASIVNITIPDLQAGLIPMIMVGTRAPTPALAARLANASFAALADDVNSSATAAHVAPSHRLTIRQLGPAASAVSTVGPGFLAGLAAALGTFLLLCAAFLAVPALRAAWRRAAMAEAGTLEPRNEPRFEASPEFGGNSGPSGVRDYGAPQAVQPWHDSTGDDAVQHHCQGFEDELRTARRTVNRG